MGTKDKVIEEFKLLLEENKRNVEAIVEVAEGAGLTNEQFYIDWEDFVNELVTKEHPPCKGYMQ